MENRYFAERDCKRADVWYVFRHEGLRDKCVAVVRTHSGFDAVDVAKERARSHRLAVQGVLFEEEGP